jgi:hypothetical protein
LPGEPYDKVYPDLWYRESSCPYCIYIPRKEIMLKMMRACIGISDVQDLWFNLDMDKVKQKELMKTWKSKRNLLE